MTRHTKESTIARYNELQPEGGSKFTPRAGFYFIQEVFEDSKYLAIYKAKALWKEHETEDFIEGAEVEIQLTSLKETAPNPQGFDPEALKNTTVVIQEIFWSETVYKAKKYSIVKCVWAIHKNLPVIRPTTPKTRTSIPSFLDLPGSLIESMLQFEQSISAGALAAMHNDENSQINQASLGEEHIDHYFENPYQHDWE